MKYFKSLSLLFLIVGLMTAGCNSGGSASSLASLLRGHTFQLETNTEALEEALEEACGEEVTVGVDSSALTLSTGTIQASSELDDESELTISFSDDTYIVREEDGEVVSTGTWRAIDGNTIEVTDDGDDETVQLDVQIQGDRLIISLPDELIDDLVSASCSPGSEEVPVISPEPSESPEAPNDDSPEDDSDTLAGALSGTWCYDSGSPYYLAVQIDTAGGTSSTFATYEASVAYVYDNENFLDGITDTLEFTSRNLGVNEVYQTAWIATFSVGGSQPGIVPFATIEFVGIDQQAISIDFGSDQSGSYVRSSSLIEGECPDLTVDESDLDALPEGN